MTDKTEKDLSEELEKLKLAYDELQQQYFESFCESQRQITKYSQLQSLIHNASEGMILFNPDATVLSFNLAAQRILGYAEIDVMYQTADHIFPMPEKYQNNIVQYLRESFNDESKSVLYATHANGNSIPLKISISEVSSAELVMFDDDTEFDEENGDSNTASDLDLFAISFVDLTDELEKQTQIEVQQQYIEQALQESEKTSQLKSDFIGNISHELRTPLNGILGLSEVLKDSALSAEQYTYVENIYTSGKKLLNIVDNILQFSRYENERTLEPETVNTRDILAKIRDEYSTVAEQKNIQFKIRKQKTVSDELSFVDSGFYKLVQVLVDNAVKFTDKGEVVLSLSLTEENQSSLLIVTVADTGIGIAEENLDRLFTPFSQADTSIKRAHGGLGLGLNIVKQISDTLNATVDIQSSKDKGTTFTITIPLQQEIYPLIDTKVIRSLQSQLGDTFVELIKIFTEDTREKLEQLEKLIEVNDKQSIKDMLNYLLGSAGNVGAERLKQDYSDLLPVIDEQDQQQLQNRYRSLIEDFTATSEHLLHPSSKLLH